MRHEFGLIVAILQYDSAPEPVNTEAAVLGRKTEPWACCDCDCTEKLEERMEGWGRPFLEVLREAG